MKRFISLVLFFGLIGFAVGYALFGRDGAGNWISLFDLFLPAARDLGGVFQGIGTALRTGFRAEEVRRTILIGAAVGAGIGVLVAMTTGRPRRR